MNEVEIRGWLARNYVDSLLLTSEEVDHITMCLYRISRWYFEDYPLGDFLRAVVKNDFTGACLRADSINQKVLHVYAMFCMNHIGHDYQDKANGRGRRAEK